MLDDFMKKTGKNNKVILHYSDTFLNSQCLFVAYHDVIKSPWYVFILAAKDTKQFKMIYNTLDLEGLDYDGVYEWYRNRDNINPLFSIPLNEGILERFFDSSEEKYKMWANEFINQEMEISDIINNEAKLQFATVLTNLLRANMAKDIVIYSPHYSKAIEKDIENLYGNKVRYLNGDIKEVLSKIPKDSTYVMSDIHFINTLIELDRLNFSSILLATRYGYNYGKDGNLLIDIDELSKKYVFKMNYFNII